MQLRGSKIGDTTPVDRYPKGASPYGALDMAGNVWEWTGSEQAYQSIRPMVAEDQSGSDWRVVRGGSSRRCARSSAALTGVGITLTRRFDNIGFRVCTVI